MNFKEKCNFMHKNSNLWTLVEYVGSFNIVNLIANFVFCLFYYVKLFITIDDKIHQIKGSKQEI